MKRRLLLILLHIVVVLSLTSCTNSEESTSSTFTELTISAAASMKEPLLQIGERFEQEHDTIQLHYNFGGSGALKNQIVHGAPVDVFISAAPIHIKELIEKEIMKEEHAIPFIRNSLVWITHQDKEAVFANIIQGNQPIAIGTPATVPAGMYAKQALESAEMWSAVKNRIVFTKDVRHVLSLVEQQSVMAGVVYQSDALSSDHVTIVETIDPSLHESIEYMIGVPQSSNNKQAALSFMEFLQSEEGVSVLQEAGFTSMDMKQVTQ
ncbi:molybdate ABC transporter substrate-binding protein [Pontibacillus litoralis]|uniref:molybdate ABC transporter substrate-binding protein n=1 Tax=Pontibacillus litoralis TaxID=516703 RepID=UPI0018DE3DFA|nr:molybdate ABC transporter substrate-binding protein [Pontibacillus litoralis]